MEIDFEELIELQRLDSEIQEAATALEALPRLLEAIDGKITATDGLVTTARDKLVLNQKRRRDLEGEIKDFKVIIGKYKRQLTEVKTNKEYTSIMKEIEDTQHKIDGLEESIIGEMINADNIEGEIKTALQKKAQETESFNREKKSLQDKARGLEEKKASLTASRASILAKVPQDQLKLYELIFRKRGGQVISPVKNEFCSLCHMRIRPQMINEIRERTEIITCENCGRILFYAEDQAPEGGTAAPAPEAPKER